MNQCMISGRLGADGELRRTNAGTAVMEVSVAVAKKINDEFVTSWIRCVLWGKTAEIWAPWCKKGTEVIVSGELQEQKWTGKDGAHHSAIKLNAFFFRTCVSRKGEAAEAAHDDGGPEL